MNTTGKQGILITGATGFVGGEVLARLLERTEQPIYALVRADGDAEAADRLRVVVESLLGDAGEHAGQVLAVSGDVTMPWLGIQPSRRDWLAARVGAIIHCAASVSFTLGLDESRAINLDGTRRMLELAERCRARGGLDYFLHVSTSYVAGDFDGVFTERDHDVGQGFRNAYEQSKFEAEALIRRRRTRLPTQVVRPSIVVGDSRSGWTPAFNVLYGPMRAFSQGAYQAIPASGSSPVDVVPVDYVADSILALAGRPGTTYHLTAGRRAVSVDELIALGCGYTGRAAPQKIPPRLYRRAIHPLLLRAVGERRRKALRASEVYFPYFDIRTRYATGRTERILRPLGIEPPPLRSYFDRLMAYAEAAEWGETPLARHETFVPAAERKATSAGSRPSSRRGLRSGRPALGPR